jgi:hypothetical protein
MQLPGEMNLQALALLGNLPEAGEGAGALATRMFDTEGDGRSDLFVVDFDGDGAVDGVVRGLDLDGDGLVETFAAYDEDGEIRAVGRLDPETREFEVAYEDTSDFEDLVSSLGLADTPAPDEALFTTFDDPYFVDSFGSAGEEVPEALEDDVMFAPAEIAEVDEADLEALDTGAAVMDEEESASSPDAAAASDGGSRGERAEGAAAEGEDADSALPEVTPRVVEIEDYSGAGDGSDLHAHIDRDGDGLADDEERLSRTSDGTWHGDINKDGYSEDVAFDRDQDGRIESVDTAGRGSSSDIVGAEQVASPESESIVDRHAGEDDSQAEAEAAAAQAGVSDGNESAPADEASAAAAADAGDDFSSSAPDADSGAAADSADDSTTAYDGGPDASPTDTDDDAGSTTIDSGSTDSGDTDTT